MTKPSLQRIVVGSIMGGVYLLLLILMVCPAETLSIMGLSQSVSFFDLMGAVGNLQYFGDSLYIGFEAFTGLLSIILLIVLIGGIILSVLFIFMKHPRVKKEAVNYPLSVGVYLIITGIFALVSASLAAGELNNQGGQGLVDFMSGGGICFMIFGVLLIVAWFVLRKKLDKILKEKAE